MKFDEIPVHQNDASFDLIVNTYLYMILNVHVISLSGVGLLTCIVLQLQFHVVDLFF